MKIWNFVTGAFQVNTFVVHLKDKYVFVVDPGGDILTISQFLAAQELEPVAIVCTHGHFDHIFGIQDLRETNGNIPLVAHPEEKCYFGSDALEAHGYDLQMMGLPQLTEALSNIPEPDCWVEEGDTLAKVAGIPCPEEAAQWKILHTPGHSSGSICLYNQQEGALISGDTLFYGGYGHSDLYSGNQQQLYTSLRRIMQLPPDTKLYPGHSEFDVPLKEAIQGPWKKK